MRLIERLDLILVLAAAFRKLLDDFKNLRRRKYDPTRFKRSRSVGAYVGLTTRRHASGEVDWSGRISKCGDAMLRMYLFEAAGVLLTRVPKWGRR
jgi:transposase